MRRAIPVVIAIMMLVAVPTASAGDAPTVVSYGPSGEGIMTGPIVTVTFSELMDTSNVSIAIPGVSGDIESRNPTFNLEIDGVLDYGTTYEVTVTGSSMAGVAMVPFTWSFTTAPASSTLRGRVVDVQGDPVAGASLTVDGSSAGQTSSEGSFELTLYPGEHTLVVSSGGDVRTIEVDVTAGELRDVGNIVLGSVSEGGGSILLYGVAIVAALLVAGGGGYVLVRRRRQP